MARIFELSQRTRNFENPVSIRSREVSSPVRRYVVPKFRSKGKKFFQASFSVILFISFVVRIVYAMFISFSNDPAESQAFQSIINS